MRDKPEFSTTAVLSISSLPRRTKPSRFTRSYSDACVKRRAFEKENEVGWAMSSVIWISFVIQSASVQQKSSPERISGEDFAKKKARIYGVGEASAGDSVVPPVDVDVEDSVVEAGLVASVVVGGLVAAGLAAGSVVSVFCSHAARSAALARMQIYFFIVLIGRGILL